MRRSPAALAAAAAALLMAAACGEGSAPGTAGESGTAPQESAATAPAEVAEPVGASDDVPDLELIDVATGDPVNLRSLVPADTPLLLWFWAPH